MKRTMITMAAVAASALALAACGSAESVGGNASTGSSENGSTTLVVGSQDYYSNEIIAEAYAQALEGAGFTVDRQLRIGQREVYMPEIEAGAIDVFPEYTGNLLQYLDADATARSTDEVYAALQTALPSGLRALEQAPATDQDSYVVTADFAAAHSLSSIGDLAGAGTLTLGGNSELQTRPYGPTGLSQTYGVTVNFTPIEDSGGPLTVKALKDGDIQADAMLLREGEDCGRIGRGEVDAGRMRRYARIARRGEELRQQRRLREFPGERMFATPRPQ